MEQLFHFLPWTEKRLKGFTEQQLKMLLSPVTGLEQDQTEVITNLMVLLYNRHHGTIDLKRFRHRAQVVEWYRCIGVDLYNIESLIACLKHGQLQAVSEKLPGVNLVGYSRGRLGLGEDLRLMAPFLLKVGIPFSVFRLGHPSDSNEYSELHQFESSHVKYHKSVFFMNAIELEKLIALYDDFQHRFGYTIAIPPWELPKAPARWIDTLEKFDEVWSISNFVKQAYDSIGLDTKLFPPFVDESNVVCNVARRQKSYFTFMYIFDANSFLQRKNPQAIVEAFLLAFPNVRENVRLVLKVSNSKSDKDWDELQSLCAQDYRIKIIDNLADSTFMEGLWSKCDCYVSLHRSEGFGRTLAEAALRKIPIVTTGWSGSQDIVGDNYPLSVSFTERELGEGEYPEWQNQHWAVPLIDDAVAKLKKVYSARNNQSLLPVTERTYLKVKSEYSINDSDRRELIRNLSHK